LRNKWIILILACLVFPACSRPKTSAPTDDGPIKSLRQALAEGNYEDALKRSKEITSQIPPGPYIEEALYLQGYDQAFGRSDFQGARSPLKQLLDLAPAGRFASGAQKLLADCQYWQGHYQTAAKEYRKLASVYPGKGLDSYALMQTGNCLLLDDKVADALDTYREIVEKYPTDPLADSAQLMVANSYLKLQNFPQAKTELQKLMSVTHDKDIQQEAQKALRQLEEEEPFRKGVGVPE
jgi:TolA-binding protein